MASKLKREFLDLLKTDEEFRYAVAGLIGYGEILEELRRLREDFSKRFERNDKKFERMFERLEEHDRKFELMMDELKKLREDFNRRFEEHEARLEDGLRRLERRLDALGSRWGLMSESAFREERV